MIMAAHRDPAGLHALSVAVGELARAARGAGDELLDELAVFGEFRTQRAVDDAVDALVAGVHAVAADAGELALILGSQAGPVAPTERVDEHTAR